ncbi:DUF6973 domain-containing protein [Terrihabitans sp. B22-R8]|uniref:DUF6973 domain-containing protein n=1 Tax=Terrihabitans sp. B22-R8 TaxID=3425128 RepID=UPI00403C7127
MAKSSVASVSAQERSQKKDAAQDPSSSSAGNSASSADFNREVAEARAAEQERRAAQASSANDNDAAQASGPASQSASGSDDGAVQETGSTSGDTGIPDAVNTIVDPADEIARLDSDGDQVTMNITAEGKAQIPLARIPVGVGVKGQYGFDIGVTRNGDGGEGQAAPTYDVTFNKRLQGGLTGEIGVPGVDPAAELNLGTADSVTMSFDSSEEAARAVSILQRLGASEAARDAINAPIPGVGSAGAASNPIPEGDGSFSDGLIDTHSWPTPGNIATAGLRPPEEDMAFLRDNITGFTQEVTGQERLKLGAKAANLGVETRLDANARMIRTVELPRDGEPGKLTYTMAGDLDSSTKEKFTVGQQQFDQFEVGYIPQNIVDHGTMRGEVSLSWDLPADESYSEIGGRPLPELDGLGAPDELSTRLELNYQTQSLLDLSRTDQRRITLEASVRNPTEHAGQIASSLLDGDLPGAFADMGSDTTVNVKDENIQRTGSHQQHELGLTVVDTGKFGISLIADIGRDDIVSRRSASFSGADMAKGVEKPEAPTPVPEVDDPLPAETVPPEQFVVVPHDGLNIRDEPNGERISAFRNGTFIDGTGERRLDANGDEWIEVTGRDVNGTETSGWVNGRYLQANSTGDMGPTGRINPGLEEQGYQAVEIQDGDNVWDIARRNNVDPQEAVALNSEHLIDPNLIFAGDTVYLPGTAAPPPPPPPKPEPAPPVEPQPQPQDDSTPSGPDHPSESPSVGSDPSASGVDGSNEPGSSSSTGDDDSASGSSSDPSADDAPAVEEGRGSTATPPPPADNAGTDELDRILRDYQVVEDPRGTVEWSPGGLAGLFTDKSRELTATEADLMDTLNLFELKDMRDIKSKAEETALEQYPIPDDLRNGFPDGREVPENFDRWAQNDGHADAFRHAYWNALMTKRFGSDFAERFATAHEGTVNNPADREAMDLHNNEIGRNIAQANPNASEEELADLVRASIENGEMVVIDRSGELAWSDDVEISAHGEADDVPAPGLMETPELADSAS